MQQSCCRANRFPTIKEIDRMFERLVQIFANNSFRPYYLKKKNTRKYVMDVDGFLKVYGTYEIELFVFSNDDL